MANREVLLVDENTTCNDLYNHYTNSQENGDELFLEMKESSKCNFLSKVMVVHSFLGNQVCIYSW